MLECRALCRMFAGLSGDAAMQSPYRCSELVSFLCVLILFFTTSAVNFSSNATTLKNQTSRWKVQRDDGVLYSETILTHFSARRRAEQNIDLLAIVQCRCSHVAGDATIMGHCPCCFNNFHCRTSVRCCCLPGDTTACRCHSPCGNVVCIYAFVLLWQSNPVRNDRYPSQTIRRAAALIPPPMLPCVLCAAVDSVFGAESSSARM